MKPIIRSTVNRLKILFVGVLMLASGSCSGTFYGNGHDGTFASDRLYFGRNIPSGGSVSDSAWNAFLSEVVTPEFPNGLTVLRGNGQWMNSNGTLELEEVMVVEVIHPANEPPDSIFSKIAHRYRTLFNQEAVLRTTGPVRFQLYESLPR